MGRGGGTKAFTILLTLWSHYNNEINEWVCGCMYVYMMWDYLLIHD